jgi:hypothetical protein
MTTLNLNGNNTIGHFAKRLKQENELFKSYVIEYGYYVIAGIAASIIQHSLGISAWQFWTVFFIAIAYYVSLRYVHHLAWGKDV